MTRQDEERQQLERALGRMEKHLLSRLERTFNNNKGPAATAQKVRESSIFQRFFHRLK